MKNFRSQHLIILVNMRFSPSNLFIFTWFGILNCLAFNRSFFQLSCPVHCWISWKHQCLCVLRCSNQILNQTVADNAAQRKKFISIHRFTPDKHIAFICLIFRDTFVVPSLLWSKECSLITYLQTQKLLFHFNSKQIFVEGYSLKILFLLSYKLCCNHSLWTSKHRKNARPFHQLILNCFHHTVSILMVLNLF